MRIRMQEAKGSHSPPRRMFTIRFPSIRVQPARSRAARVESMVLVPTLHSLGQRPWHSWQTRLKEGGEGRKEEGLKIPHLYSPVYKIVPLPKRCADTEWGLTSLPIHSTPKWQPGRVGPRLSWQHRS